MNKLDKAIQGLKTCIENIHLVECPKQCPYYEACNKYEKAYAIQPVIRDALELLKAQEPILLKNQHKPGGHIINANSPWVSRCPKCNKKIEGKQTKFCKYCGQAVKWE